MRAAHVIANLGVANVETAKSFYTDYLGLSTEEFDLGWVARYTCPGTEVNVQLVTQDATAPEDAVISVLTDDVEAALEEAQRLGYEIVHPLTTEPWGHRRFLVRAPDGNVINIGHHPGEMAAVAPSSGLIGERIDRPAHEVYEYTSDPANLPSWASGLGTSVEVVDGQWVAESPMGRVVVAFAPRNDYGVLDHDVTLPSGETVRNPMRVIADGAGCDVVFTLRRGPEMGDEDFARDAAKVAADLATLKRVLEDR